jgi:hypothetical protein
MNVKTVGSHGLSERRLVETFGVITSLSEADNNEE